MSAPMTGEPIFEVGYEVEGAARSVRLSGDGVAVPAAAAGELGVGLAHGTRTGAWRLYARPQAEGVRVTSVTVRMAADVRGSEAVYLNGYQSWTDSVEHRPWDTMVGLANVPGAVVDAFSLDAGGDYRFCRYDVLPGEMHGFGYGYLRQGYEVSLVGSLSEDTGLTVVRTSARRQMLTLEKEPPQVPLAAGERRELASFVVCRGTLAEATGAWLALAGIRRRPAPPLVGYSSWYRHYGNIDAGRLFEDLEGVADVLGTTSGDPTPAERELGVGAGRSLGGAVALFQVDDGWCRVGDWARPSEERFPQGMEAVASAVSARGLLPGLWLAPFLCETESRLFAEHQDWLLRDDEGRPYVSRMNWSGACALDTLNPEVRDYVRMVLRQACAGWGFRFLKLDFLFAACYEPHGGKNRGELMADALGLVREAVGEDVLLDFCGVPLVSAMGQCEYCRVGCDVGLDWDDAPYMRLLHRERISTRWSIANTLGRAHLDGRAFRNDPDVFILRDDGVRLSRDQRLRLVSADALNGGMFLTSDDMGAWTPAQRQQFEIQLARFLERQEGMGETGGTPDTRKGAATA